MDEDTKVLIERLRELADDLDDIGDVGVALSRPLISVITAYTRGVEDAAKVAKANLSEEVGDEIADLIRAILLKEPTAPGK
jgi:hypothetical protein